MTTHILAHGAVTDWVHVAAYPATFNVADVCIRVGIIIALTLRALHHRAAARGLAAGGIRSPVFRAPRLTASSASPRNTKDTTASSGVPRARHQGPRLPTSFCDDLSLRDGPRHDTEVALAGGRAGRATGAAHISTVDNTPIR